MKLRSILLTGLLLMSMCAIVSPASAELPPTDLQAMIDSAQSGDTITFDYGDYEILDSSITIGKSITLQCEGGLFDLYYSSPNDTNDAIHIEHHGDAITVTMRNFEISNARKGIFATGDVHLIIEGCAFHDNAENDIHMDSSEKALISDSVFFDMDQAIDNSHIFLEDSSADVSNCTFGATGALGDENIGIYSNVRDTAPQQLTVTDCIFNRIRNGVLLEAMHDSSYDLTMRANTFNGPIVACAGMYYGLYCDISSIGETEISSQIISFPEISIDFSENTATNITCPALFRAEQADVEVTALNNTLVMTAPVMPEVGIGSNLEYLYPTAFIFENVDNSAILAKVSNNTISQYYKALDWSSRSNGILGTLGASTDHIKENGVFGAAESIGCDALFMEGNNIKTMYGIDIYSYMDMQIVYIIDNSFECVIPAIASNSFDYDTCAISVFGSESYTMALIADNNISEFLTGISCRGRLDIDPAACDIGDNDSRYTSMYVECISNCISGGVAGIVYDIEDEGNAYGLIVNNLIYDGNNYPVLPEGMLSNGIHKKHMEGICILAPYATIGEFVVANNTVADYFVGCAAHVAETAEVSLVNNIFAENELYGLSYKGYDYYGGQVLLQREVEDISPSVICNDIWANGINYESIGDQTGLNGNISKDPLFVERYMLDENSPCIDTGFWDSMIMPPFDILFNSRPYGEGCDIGAYEMRVNQISPEATYSPVVSTRLAVVNSSLAAILASLPQTIPPETELMLDQIQEVLDGISLANSIQAIGKLNQAQELLEQLGA